MRGSEWVDERGGLYRENQCEMYIISGWRRSSG